MAYSIEYSTKGFTFGVLIGLGWEDGISISPDTAELDNPAYIEALKWALEGYSCIRDIYILKEYWHSPSRPMERTNQETLNRIIELGDNVKDNPYLEVEPVLLEFVEQARAQLQYKEQKTREKERREARKREPKPGYIYLIQSPTGHYKIGRTKDLHNRLKTFGVQLPFEVEFICVIETDDMYGLERRLHEHFAAKRVNGEWFALDTADVEFLKYFPEVQS